MFNDFLIDNAKKVFYLASNSNIKIVSAESCTGGLIASVITEIPGSSRIFDCGFVCYSNLSKEEKLFVANKTLEKFGAVSEEVAKEMAIGAIKNSNANLSIATTGISGPDGGSIKKPLGLTFISSFNSFNNNLIIKKFNFSHDRTGNRILATKNALQILLEQLQLIKNA